LKIESFLKIKFESGFASSNFSLKGKEIPKENLGCPLETLWLI